MALCRFTANTGGRFVIGRHFSFTGQYIDNTDGEETRFVRVVRRSSVGRRTATPELTLVRTDETSQLLFDTTAR